jgi:hypothetical protein
MLRSRKMPNSIASLRIKRGHAAANVLLTTSNPLVWFAPSLQREAIFCSEKL